MNHAGTTLCSWGGGPSPQWLRILQEVIQKIRDKTRSFFLPLPLFKDGLKSAKPRSWPSVPPHAATNSPQSGLAWVSDMDSNSNFAAFWASDVPSQSVSSPVFDIGLLPLGLSGHLPLGGLKLQQAGAPGTSRFPALSSLRHPTIHGCGQYKVENP